MKNHRCTTATTEYYNSSGYVVVVCTDHAIPSHRNTEPWTIDRSIPNQPTFWIDATTTSDTDTIAREIALWLALTGISLSVPAWHGLDSRPPYGVQLSKSHTTILPVGAYPWRQRIFPAVETCSLFTECNRNVGGSATTDFMHVLRYTTLY